jgi:hypothetical protein
LQLSEDHHARRPDRVDSVDHGPGDSRRLGAVPGASHDDEDAPALKGDYGNCQERWLMSSMAISLIVFACVFGGALLGMFLHHLLPQRHLSTDSKDVVKLGMGLIATMAALVLGLLIASAKSSFDAQRSALAQMSANVILIDRVMAHYGPETKQPRDLLRRFVASTLDRIWPEDSSQPAQVQPTGEYEGLYDRIQELSPKSESQRSLQAQALKTSIDIGQTRWLLFAQRGSSIPPPFLVVLVFWLTILFASFSLFAPPNATVFTTLLVCALSVSGAIFLILELDRPFEGLIQISSAPLRNALEQLGK